MFKKNIFRREKDKDLLEEYAELPLQIEEQKHVKIMIDNMESYASADRILRKVREGHIVVAQIKQLRNQNMDQLKAAVSKIKAVTETIEGDVVGIGEEWLVVTPKNVKIQR